MITTINTSKKIDIHSHILNVDHGSSNINDSIKMLEEAKKLKIKEIVCTPHYYGKDTLKEFKILKEYAKKMNITLYLGNEIVLNEMNTEDIINNKAHTINNTHYVLVELLRNNDLTILEVINLIKELDGYKVIFAHPELIKNFRKVKYIKALKNNNVLIQCDASSMYGKFKEKLFFKKLLNKNLIDVIASDKHIFNDNFNLFNECYRYVYNKNGKLVCEKLFYKNPRKILNDKTVN